MKDNEIGISSPLLLRACRHEPVERVPVWFMRQAGRMLPGYRALREKYSFIELATTPALAAEVTLEPVRRLDVDAAIIFHDILLPLRPMGAGFDFADKPVLERPIRTLAQIEAMRAPDDPRAFAYLHESLRIVREQLPPEKAVIGFAGAPFTLANYLIEGGGSDENGATMRMMRTEPNLLRRLLDILAEATVSFLRGQIEHGGAQAVQLFESSGGALSPDEYAVFAWPCARRVIDAVGALGAPVIFFPRGQGASLELFADCEAEVIGIDWETPLETARARLGGKAVQGNLDPAALLKPIAEIERRVAATLDAAGDLRGYIFNLGHGVLPETPPEHAAACVEAVRRLSAERLSR